jgi:UPF0755 protein
MKKLKIFGIVAAVVAVAAVVIGYFWYQNLFSAPERKAETEQVIVPLSVSDSDELIGFLKDKGFIKSEYGFRIAFLKTLGTNKPLNGISHVVCVDCFSAGAYKLSKSMNAWELAREVTGKPYMEWVVLPEGWRKEQMAEVLASRLGWNDKEKGDWIEKYTAMDSDYVEGVYFPDTYLIPVDEAPIDVAERMRKRFDEQFAPYSQEAIKQNVKWTTLVKIASLIQREAGGKDDMAIISGVIWNRLLDGKRLEIDATVQYVIDSQRHYLTDVGGYMGYVGDDPNNDGWWKPLKAGDTKQVSSYNTYLNSGLPPRPICNPGLDAIKAALYPAQTECFFYLHDSSGQIHCAKTYTEHLANIDKYLK